jgi:hypothetical protein
MLREALEEAKLSQTIDKFKQRFELLTKSSDEKKYGTGKKTVMVAVQGKTGTFYRQQQVGRKDAAKEVRKHTETNHKAAKSGDNDKQKFMLGTLDQYSAGRKNAQALYKKLKNGHHASKADYDAAIKDLHAELNNRNNLAERSQIETLISNLKKQSPTK